MMWCTWSFRLTRSSWLGPTFWFSIMPRFRRSSSSFKQDISLWYFLMRDFSSIIWNGSKHIRDIQATLGWFFYSNKSLLHILPLIISPYFVMLVFPHAYFDVQISTCCVSPLRCLRLVLLCKWALEKSKKVNQRLGSVNLGAGGCPSNSKSEENIWKHCKQMINSRQGWFTLTYRNSTMSTEWWLQQTCKLWISIWDMSGFFIC